MISSLIRVAGMSLQGVMDLNGLEVQETLKIIKIKHLHGIIPLIQVQVSTEINCAMRQLNSTSAKKTLKDRD